MDKLAELLPQAFLRLCACVLIWGVVEAGGRDFRSEPVSFGEADDKWDEVLFDLLLRELVADLVQGLDGLIHSQ